MSPERPLLKAVRIRSCEVAPVLLRVDLLVCGISDVDEVDLPDFVAPRAASSESPSERLNPLSDARGGRNGQGRVDFRHIEALDQRLDRDEHASAAFSEILQS